MCFPNDTAELDRIKQYGDLMDAVLNELMPLDKPVHKYTCEACGQPCEVHEVNVRVEFPDRDLSGRSHTHETQLFSDCCRAYPLTEEELT